MAGLNRFWIMLSLLILFAISNISSNHKLSTFLTVIPDIPNGSFPVSTSPRFTSRLLGVSNFSVTNRDDHCQQRSPISNNNSYHVGLVNGKYDNFDDTSSTYLALYNFTDQMCTEMSGKVFENPWSTEKRMYAFNDSISSPQLGQFGMNPLTELKNTRPVKYKRLTRNGSCSATRSELRNYTKHCGKEKPGRVNAGPYPASMISRLTGDQISGIILSDADSVEGNEMSVNDEITSGYTDVSFHETPMPSPVHDVSYSSVPAVSPFPKAPSLDQPSFPESASIASLVIWWLGPALGLIGAVLIAGAAIVAALITRRGNGNHTETRFFFIFFNDNSITSSPVSASEPVAP